MTPPCTPSRRALQQPVGSWLSLTWAEALTLLRGALGPFLGGAGTHPCSFLRLFLHTLILLCIGTA